MGNQIAGSDMNQNKKKHMKSRVFVPEEAANELAELQTSERDIL